MKATNIRWDVDYEGLLEDLPTEIEIPNGMLDEEEISDYITDETGFCHKGFELIDENKGIEMIKNIIYIDSELLEALGELKVELNNGEQYHIIYYVDKYDEWHFFYKDGKKPDYIDFEYDLMCNLS